MADEEVTSQQRNHPPTMSSNEKVSNLLTSWGLPELASKFKFHEIEYRALLCLTEKDICELIPKIGRRAIFRSSLLEWRRKNSHHSNRRSDIQILPSSTLRIASTRAATPTPSNIEEISNTNITVPLTPADTVIKSEQIHSDYESEEISENMQNHNDDMNDDFDEMQTEEDLDDVESLDRPSNEIPERKEKKYCVLLPLPTKKTSSNCHVSVSEILSNSPEGRQIIAYYEVNGGFDYCHRRRLVSVIINEVVRKNRWLVQDDFAKISRDIIQLFPREDITTYYTARNGLKNPKGCLYNKFLNLTRKLRQEARHLGEVKSYKMDY
ncbi:uncharacterized protein LOC129919076 isoform X2 [Episyrphus balteatus]|uniref:uncharacterized protein LOC129919076 isoform X2 n=1 Tax=Episyrphus balteatus TaxID=286459 RepID=UPI002485B79A|nr:uncharacterized protein LOC129919076 isoform X2 [Episyrphus balteatus]